MSLLLVGTEITCEGSGSSGDTSHLSFDKFEGGWRLGWAGAGLSHEAMRSINGDYHQHHLYCPPILGRSRRDGEINIIILLNILLGGF